MRSNKSVTQEQNILESGQGCGADIGSGSTVGSDFETGRIISRPTGLVLEKLGPSPSESYRPIPDRPISSGHKGYETTFVRGEHGLNQDLVLRLPMPFVCNISIPSESNIAEEENKELNKEESKIREDLPKDNDCDQMERYVKNYNDQSPSSRFSVFWSSLATRGPFRSGGYLWV